MGNVGKYIIHGSLGKVILAVFVAETFGKWPFCWGATLRFPLPYLPSMGLLYLPKWMVDIYGKLVSIYTIPMDAAGFGRIKREKQLVSNDSTLNRFRKMYLKNVCFCSNRFWTHYLCKYSKTKASKYTSKSSFIVLSTPKTHFESFLESFGLLRCFSSIACLQNNKYNLRATRSRSALKLYRTEVQCHNVRGGQKKEAKSGMGCYRSLGFCSWGIPRNNRILRMRILWIFEKPSRSWTSLTFEKWLEDDPFLLGSR